MFNAVRWAKIECHLPRWGFMAFRRGSHRKENGGRKNPLAVKSPGEKGPLRSKLLRTF